VFVVGLYLAFCSIAGIYLGNGTLHPSRRVLTQDETSAYRESLSRFNAQLQDVAIKTPDGVTLNAWIVKPEHANDEAVVLLHGLADNRLGMTGYAQLLLARGFTVLLPDARAHGSSGGALATFGLLERNDVAQWDQLLRTRTTGHCVYGLGESMGAAQLLQSLGSGADFCAVIAESSFSSFREIAYDRIGQPLHLGPWVGRTILRPVVEAAFLRALWKYALDMQQVSPEDAVAKTHVPVFLIHGQVDSNIPVRHSRRIVARDRAAVLWEVPGAEHCGALSAAPEQFRKVLVTWFPAASPSMKRVARE
jgi:alpha-beta hydrolase superfamily lysophospholipase